MKKLFLIITLSLLAESSYAWRCCQKGGGDAPGIFLTKKRCEKDGFDVKEGLNASCGSAAAGVLGMGSGIVSCAKKVLIASLA